MKITHQTTTNRCFKEKMKQFSRKYLKNACHLNMILLSLFSFLPICKAKASETNYELKVVIIDNFHTQKFSSEKYKNYYLNGVQEAVKKAKKYKILIHYDAVNYGTNPLDIYYVFSKVKRLNPDLIIGPRSSNFLTALKNQFNDVMILSPFASADIISKLPKNFYSLTLPNQHNARAISQFISSKYHKNNIFILTQADCKSCVDISRHFKTIHSKNNPSIRIRYNSLIMDNLNALNFSESLKGYSQGDIIFLSCMGYQAAILMSRITDYLKQPVTFIGDDNWGSWKETIVGKVNAKHPYQGFRIVPWSIDDKAEDLRQFIYDYELDFKDKPDIISYAAYRTLYSAIIAFNKYHQNCLLKSEKGCMISAYQKAVRLDANWFKSKNYHVYQVKQSGETYIGKI